MYMKISSQPLNQTLNRKQGFTLIEMIGVLAVIAILAAVLIPKVFEAINNAKVNNAAMSCQTVKTALADHYAKFGALTAGVTTPPTTIVAPTNFYDGFLVKEGFLDKPFAVKIGNGLVATTIELDTAEAVTVNPTAPLVPSVTAHVAGCSAFNLDGTGATGVDWNKAIGSAVIYAVITGVNLNDARDLNTRIDGTAAQMGEAGFGCNYTAGTETDLAGRVKYTFAGPTATVYVYLTHR